MSEWRPIQTAPKDGTEILAWDGLGMALIYYYEPLDAWAPVGFYMGELGVHDKPTHWMPAPKPPTEDKP